MPVLHEFHGGVPTPAAHPEILPVFTRANAAFPQIYGGMIVRTGRMAMDLMVGGELSAADFSRSNLDHRQIEEMMDAARTAHERAGVPVPHIPNPEFYELNEQAVTPVTLQSVYTRTKRGILSTIQEFTAATLGTPDDAPVNPDAERLFMATRLYQPENAEKAKLLQAIWKTADEAIDGRKSAEITATLHRSLKTLPKEANERAYYVAKTARVARTALNNLIKPALAELEQHASEVLGNEITAVDVTSMFPLLAIYEGADEMTDDDLALIKQGEWGLFEVNW